MPAPNASNADPHACDHFTIDAVPVSLLDTPVDYIFTDNMRQRQFCNILKISSEGGVIGVDHARMIVDFMTRDLVWHFADEQDDLFPKLRRRAHPEDGLGLLLERIDADRHQISVWHRIIVDALLLRARSPVPFGPDVRTAMASYADIHRRHLAIENGIILSIARIRLTKSDRAAMSLSMKKRRGVLSDVAHA